MIRFGLMLGTAALASACFAPAAWAQVSVNATVDTSTVRAVMPDVGLGLHTSVYANQFGNPTLPGLLDASGVQLLRYPGGSYSDIYQWSLHDSHGGYTASASHFGNYIGIMEQTGSKGMITVNYGSSLLGTMGGQPQEAAAWVAYANGDASLYNTANDVTLGLDAEGNDWKTVGYWANLRASTPAENPDDQYDFLAINHDAPVGISRWEIGNEINGNGYYSDIASGWNWEYDLHSPYDGSRGNEPDLSPTAYGQNFNAYVAAMKAVDPTIQVGAVLTDPGGVGDVSDPARNWNRNVLLEAGDAMDFGIVHYYVNNTSNSQLLHDPAGTVPNIFDSLRQDLADFTTRDPNDIELHMTEFGFFNSVDNPVLSGLFAADVYATALAEGATSVHWLELSKDSFLGDASTQTPGPAYYAMQMLAAMMDTGDDLVQADTDSPDVRIHAVRQADGSFAFMLINLGLDPGSDAIVTVDLGGDALSGLPGTRTIYGYNDLVPTESTVMLNGSSFDVDVPYGSVVTLIVPVPEPTGIALLAPGLLLLLRRHREMH